MKKQVVMGMAMAVAVSFSVNANAVVVGKARPVDVRIEYRKSIESKYDLKGKSVSDMTQKEVKALHESILKDINLGKDANGNVRTASKFTESLRKRPAESLEILKSLAAIDMMLANGGKEVKQESLEAVAAVRESLIVILLNAKKVGAFNTASNPALMSDVQFKAATEGYNKMLVEISKVPTEKYTAEESAGVVKLVKNLKDVLNENSSLTVQEAFVEAIMRTKFSHLDPKAARAEATKLLEKYKDCV